MCYDQSSSFRGVVWQSAKARLAVRELRWWGYLNLFGCRMEEARAEELEERRVEGCQRAQSEGLWPECGKEGEALLQSRERHPAGIC